MAQYRGDPGREDRRHDDDGPPHHLVAEAGTIVLTEDLRGGDHRAGCGQRGHGALEAAGTDVGDEPTDVALRPWGPRKRPHPAHPRSPLLPGRNSCTLCLRPVRTTPRASSS